jgi:hypothetical protein
MSGFWKAWIQVWCWATVVFGVVCLTAAHPAIDFGIRTYFDALAWPIDGVNELTDPAARFATALMGAVMIGWAILIFGAVRAAHEGARALWGALTVSMLVWYVTDTAASVITGFPLNAVGNTVFMVTWLIPMLATGSLKRA